MRGKAEGSKGGEREGAEKLEEATLKEEDKGEVATDHHGAKGL